MTISPRMSRKALFPLLATLATAGCAAHAAPPSASAPAATAAAAPPGQRSPDAILADSVQATGGAAAWQAHQTQHTLLTIGLQGMGMGGPAEHFQTRTNKSLMVSTLPGVGKVLEGSNGKVSWSQDPVNGLRFLDGPEAEQARIESAWNPDLTARELYARVETAADAPAGLECLTMTPRVAPVIRTCYDARTHLQVSQEGTRVTPQGDIPFRTTLRDWHDVGGVKMPYTAETQAGPVTIVTTVTEVAFDVPADDKMFDPPAPAAP